MMTALGTGNVAEGAVEGRMPLTVASRCLGASGAHEPVAVLATPPPGVVQWYFGAAREHTMAGGSGSKTRTKPLERHA